MTASVLLDAVFVLLVAVPFVFIYFAFRDTEGWAPVIGRLRHRGKLELGPHICHYTWHGRRKKWQVECKYCGWRKAEDRLDDVVDYGDCGGIY